MWVTFRLTKKYYLNGKINPNNRSVFITGCDTGFGHLLAKRLDSKGYHVFAGCLFKPGPGSEELKKSCSNRLKTLELDVTKDYSVKGASDFIKENLGSTKLWAVVNNAGIAKGWGVEFSSFKDFRDTMDVNAFGMLRVTKAFLPLIRRSKGRIVNVTSNAGRAPLPHGTTYCMSKHAASGFTDCLRQEVAELGVKVIAIEPEMFSTPLTSPEHVNKRFDCMIEDLDEEVKTGYGKKYLKNLKIFKNVFLKSTCSDVQNVIDDLESSISLVYPDSIYRPRGNVMSRTALLTYQMMPASIQDFIFGCLVFVASLQQ
ncbi:hypothetical protein JTE90_019615 [Oedothorax gibbosus]|uniref:Uncharacterized protein n=1 Tax=Oedothorax gibbosus TaxID=931172 RepID=A0AAV6V7C1_9ARAC|nr:hypothetical protein JTE90_019615 [Oedothorax gibbosus]